WDFDFELNFKPGLESGLDLTGSANGDSGSSGWILGAPVTLDPNTSSSQLRISEHLTRSTIHCKSQPLTRNPERLKISVLGYEGFISGKHSWDVEVGEYWSIGVATGTKDQRKIWSIYVYTDFLCERTPEYDRTPVLGELIPQ
ncbi:hypothetical protein L3Q82_011153, partial [Scortum barcoo]